MKNHRRAWAQSNAIDESLTETLHEMHKKLENIPFSDWEKSFIVSCVGQRANFKRLSLKQYNVIQTIKDKHTDYLMRMR